MEENKKITLNKQVLFDKRLEYFFVNDSQQDPCLYLMDLVSGKASLFDVGDNFNLSNKDLLKTEYVFITHTHMDHFIGFDNLLRVMVPTYKTINVVGPKNAHIYVSCKIKAYEWNLIEKDQINFLVTSVAENSIDLYRVSSSNAFNPVLINSRSNLNDTRLYYKVLELDNKDKVYATLLDHGTDSVGYMYQTASRLKINKDKLTQFEALPKEWISALLEKIELSKFEDKIDVVFEDGARSYKVSELYHRLIDVVPSFSFGYLTDFVFSWDNINKVKQMLTGASCLFCESTFMDEDYQKAFDKKHLSTKQLALLASYCRIFKVVPFHFSKSYKDSGMIEEEFRSFMDLYKDCDEKDIVLKIEEELSRVRK